MAAARHALRNAARQGALCEHEQTCAWVLRQMGLAAMPAALTPLRAVFVTLSEGGSGVLRGCTGTLTARLPLWEEVLLSTVQTALGDPRFQPVRPPEVPGLRIELSILTPAQALDYDGPADLIARLRPGMDGVIAAFGPRRATFLPQVWERYPQPADFLSALCHKMGAPPDAWQHAPLSIETYQALKIVEPPSA